MGGPRRAQRHPPSVGHSALRSHVRVAVRTWLFLPPEEEGSTVDTPGIVDRRRPSHSWWLRQPRERTPYHSVCRDIAARPHRTNVTHKLDCRPTGGVHSDGGRRPPAVDRSGSSIQDGFGSSPPASRPAGLLPWTGGHRDDSRADLNVPLKLGCNTFCGVHSVAADRRSTGRSTHHGLRCVSVGTDRVLRASTALGRSQFTLNTQSDMFAG